MSNSDASGKQPELVPPTDANIRRAADLLRAGELVAFPTETVYGLGADATDDRAVTRIFEAKGRPRFNPLIVHVADQDSAEAFVRFDARAERLSETLWPGPLTLVLPRRAEGGLSLLVSAGLDSVAIRIPAHPVARSLLKAAGRPIAAPSANRSGAVSPTTPLHVAESLGGRVGLILSAGRCPVGVESTVLDLTGETPVLLRPGGVIVEDLEALLGVSVLRPSPADAGGEPDAPKSPGQLASHYAPGVPVKLGVHGAAADEALLAFGPDTFIRGGATRLNLSPQGDLHEAAANLFAMLRALDRPEHAAIAVMPIPETGLGAAINDRLRRAAAPRMPLPFPATPRQD
ncbi:translation factor Sua5 [Skermanella stibiiresistens SB22]|uniref:Threonylcarbamoyl-AMP synthase n=1 Tax=Skermanella stibiiresistens SB22 TaxID=1385369 RepID=W9GQ46_9PROT|nr:L-threonylcarbamoyladenylate synthase [Skermanella stibiiresistens]EWY36020.1 translation factor Sua5 [Skermanella stibiiresistens SB22]